MNIEYMNIHDHNANYSFAGQREENFKIFIFLNSL